MNNGRMTFRFDGDQGRQRTEKAALRVVNETGVVLEDKGTYKVQPGGGRHPPIPRPMNILWIWRRWSCPGH